MVLAHRSFLGRNMGVVVLHLGLMAAAMFELGLALSLPSACVFGRNNSFDLEGRGGVCDLTKAMGFIGLVFACVILFFGWWSAQNQYYKLTLSFYRWASGGVFIGMALWLLTSILVSAFLNGTCKNNGACRALDGYTLSGWVVASCWVNMVLWFMLFCRYLHLMRLSAKNLDYDVEEDAAIEEELRREEAVRRQRALDKQEAEYRRHRELEEQARLQREREDQILIEMRLQREQEIARRRPLDIAVDHHTGFDQDEELRRAALAAETERLRRELELQKAKMEREAAERAARLAEEDRMRARAIAEEERARNLKWEEDRLRREREERERAARVAEEERQRLARWDAEDKLRRDRAAELQREAERAMARVREEEERLRRKQEQEERDRLAREEQDLQAERTRLALQTEADRLAREAAKARQEDEARLRAEQQMLAAEAERQRQEAARMAEMGRLEDANRAEAARLAAMEAANRLAQEELLADEERTRKEEEERDKAKQAKKAAGGVTPRTVNVPRIAFNSLQQAKPQIEAETKTSIKLQNTATVSNCVVTGGSQDGIDAASHKIEDLINEEIRKDFGQQTAQKGEADPEYLSWLTGKRTNMVIALSKIYDKYPQVLQIKRVFDSADNNDGISRGYLDKNQFIRSFETLFPMCKKGMGPEYAGYLYGYLDEDGDGSITWKEFIFYCLSHRLIVLKNETKR